MPKLSASHTPKHEEHWIPWLIAVLVIAHLLAFIYWMYRLAVEKPPSRSKIQ